MMKSPMRDRCVELMLAEPDLSDREVARRVGCHHATASSARRDALPGVIAKREEAARIEKQFDLRKWINRNLWRWAPQDRPKILATAVAMDRLLVNRIDEPEEGEAEEAIVGALALLAAPDGDHDCSETVRAAALTRSD